MPLMVYEETVQAIIAVSVGFVTGRWSPRGSSCRHGKITHPLCTDIAAQNEASTIAGLSVVSMSNSVSVLHAEMAQALSTRIPAVETVQRYRAQPWALLGGDQTDLSPYSPRTHPRTTEAARSLRQEDLYGSSAGAVVAMRSDCRSHQTTGLFGDEFGGGPL